MENTEKIVQEIVEQPTAGLPEQADEKTEATKEVFGQKEEEKETKSEKNTIAALAFCPVLFFIPFLMPQKRNEISDNSSNQGILLLCTFLVLRLIQALLPTSWLISVFLVVRKIFTVLQMLVFGLMAYGMYQAYNNRKYKLPLIGRINVLDWLLGNK